MTPEDIINISVVGGTLLILFIYLFRFVLRYKHQYESNPLCTSAVLFCLGVVILTTFLLVVDLYMVSIIKNPDGTFQTWANETIRQQIDNGVFIAYYSLYGLISLLIFIVIPFLHFFNEEYESNSNDRFYNAIKFTFAFLILGAFFVLLGLLVPVTPQDGQAIINHIINIVQSKSQQALNLMFSALTIAGLANVSFYTASGLFCWPIGLLMGTASVASSLDRLNDREVALRIRVNNLREKMRTSRMTPTERMELDAAENELRDLERDEMVLTGYRYTWNYRLRKVYRPLQILAGIVFTALSLFLLSTLIIVNVDRLMHGAGPKQGYILTKTGIFNPLEWVLQKTQDYVVIGPLPLLLIACYLVVATISGIRNLGLWFLFARVHRIKLGRTQPQALLFLCATIMLTVLSFNTFFYSLSNNYMTFGNQFQVPKSNNGSEPIQCNLEKYDESCILTRSSVLTMRMMSQFWFIGAVIYWWNWVFVAIASIALIACLVRGRRKATHGIVSDEDEFED